LLKTIKCYPASIKRKEDIEKIFDDCADAGNCFCAFWHLSKKACEDNWGEANRRWFFETIRNYGPLGIIAYINGEPAGWCGIAPRSKYDRLRRSRFFSAVDNHPVWSVTCFVVRKKFRRRGLSRLLLGEAIIFAQSQGAEWIEGYPFDLDQGNSRGDLYPGILTVFLAEGFVEVARRLPTRPVVRLSI
jgi:GNAT superfamily N-acetyltransferase